MENIFGEITNAFGALWNFRRRGDSLEIITPFSTSTDKYVSVFLTVRDGAWIVTDGGWTLSGQYDCRLPLEEKTYVKIFTFFMEEKEIRSTFSKSGSKVFYKGTKDRRMVPNLVFDVAGFVSQTVSVALSQFRESSIPQERFNKQVREFLADNIDPQYLRFNQPLLQAQQDTRFNAIVSSGKDNFSLVNYASGFNLYTLNRNIKLASFNFDTLNSVQLPKAVSNRIVLIDDADRSYDFTKIYNTLETCKRKNQKTLYWSRDQQKLVEILRA